MPEEVRGSGAIHTTGSGVVAANGTPARCGSSCAACGIGNLMRSAACARTAPASSQVDPADPAMSVEPCCGREPHSSSAAEMFPTGSKPRAVAETVARNEACAYRTPVFRRRVVYHGPRYAVHRSSRLRGPCRQITGIDGCVGFHTDSWKGRLPMEKPEFVPSATRIVHASRQQSLPSFAVNRHMCHWGCRGVFPAEDPMNLLTVGHFRRMLRGPGRARQMT